MFRLIAHLIALGVDPAILHRALVNCRSEQLESQAHDKIIQAQQEARNIMRHSNTK